ncbi:MAG: hypothetical protein EA425_00160 [Puniceicoccaceae bacterium]|nr:MAG: hypothetical protein EA425_00160 [Puniceicoccaceae bacterium]
MEEVGPGHAGPYWVEARAGGQTAVSEVAEVEVELSEADNDDVGPGEGGDEFVRVAGGTIETPSGALTVETFLIGRFEVTWGEWQRVRAWALENGYSFGAGQGCTDDHPVTEVAAADIFKYCNARSEMEDLKPVYTVNGDPKWNSLTAFPTKDFSADGYRLPTADEWNYAARGGQQTQGFIYSGSDVLDNVGWYQGNSENSDCPLMPHAHTLGTWPVGLKQPNELGLHDMSGNVDEWVWFLGFMNRMVFRGGSCLSGSAQAEVGASLQLSPFISRVSNRGFRLALNNGSSKESVGEKLSLALP